MTIFDSAEDEMKYHLRQIINDSLSNYLRYQLSLQKNVRKYDLSNVQCPKCFQKGHLQMYSVTDEHDTYTGLKCRVCKYDYSATH